jgi:hypothetical protein
MLNGIYEPNCITQIEHPFRLRRTLVRFVPCSTIFAFVDLRIMTKF